jgi:hypothetical protein
MKPTITKSMKFELSKSTILVLLEAKLINMDEFEIIMKKLALYYQVQYDKKSNAISL